MQHVSRILVATLVVASIQGCVSRYAKLEDPSSKQQLVCHHSGWGWIGAPLASYNHSTCVENLQQRGYVVVDQN